MSDEQSEVATPPSWRPRTDNSTAIINRMVKETVEATRLADDGLLPEYEAVDLVTPWYDLPTPRRDHELAHLQRLKRDATVARARRRLLYKLMTASCTQDVQPPLGLRSSHVWRIYHLYNEWNDEETGNGFTHSVVLVGELYVLWAQAADGEWQPSRNVPPDYTRVCTHDVAGTAQTLDKINGLTEYMREDHLWRVHRLNAVMQTIEVYKYEPKG